MRKPTLLYLLIVLTLGCSSAYYGAMEKLGYPKRALFVSRVQAAKESQEEAKAQFKNALERFKSVVNFSGGSLEQRYNELSEELERSERKAQEVKSRIASVQDVSSALFTEWENELGQYQNQNLRRVSEEKLRETKRRYAGLERAMLQAESKLDPALQPLRDNVLFLKHNLNARAIASLSTELASVNSNVDSLVSDLDRSIAESDALISHLQSSGE